MLRQARSRWSGTGAWSNECGTGWLPGGGLVFLEFWMRAMENAGGDKVRDWVSSDSKSAFRRGEKKIH